MKIALILLMLILLIPSAFARETGSIFGTVTDKETGKPIAYANVVVVGTKMGAMTLINGTYRIIGVPTGKHTIKVMMMGYEPVEKTGIIVKKAAAVEVNFALETAIAGQTQEILVEAEFHRVEVDESRKSGRSRKEFARVSPPIPLKSGIVKTGDELHVRGGCGHSRRWIERPISHRQCRPHMYRCPPAGMHNTEEYARIYENDFLEAISNPLSTFSIDVDVASYANVRRFIRNHQLPPRDAVRIEEFINYFDYDYEEPDGDVPFSINLEYAECPWNEEHGLVHIGLKGKELAREDQRPSNLVFLLDVSGSMQPPNKLPLLKKAFLLLVDELKNEDVVSIVVYAGAAGLVLPPTPGSNRGTIKAALDRLRAGGSTAGCAGIRLAYKTAKEQYIRGGNNRVILATDGDFNVGVSSTSELIDLIEEKRKEGIFLTVLGFGMGNYKDHRLEQLADKGNGNHAYIDDILEAKKVFVDDVTATLYTIAKDVKIQVEFNPAKVDSYRLIGYENRLLKKEDFDDDEKDAGEIGAGHTVTALYEIIPASGKEDAFGGYELSYLETKLKREARRTDEILTVKVRYKEPDGDKSKLIRTSLKGEAVAVDRASDNFRFSAAVAMFALILRDSKYRGDSSLEDVRELAKSSMGEDPFTHRAEFRRIVERTELIFGLSRR